ncbi:unnamed protein product [Leuciscus chuanchicus]
MDTADTLLSRRDANDSLPRVTQAKLSPRHSNGPCLLPRDREPRIRSTWSSSAHVNQTEGRDYALKDHASRHAVSHHSAEGAGLCAQRSRLFVPKCFLGKFRGATKTKDSCVSLSVSSSSRVREQVDCVCAVSALVNPADPGPVVAGELSGLSTDI